MAIKFYEDDKYSIIIPGSKDYISVGKKQHMQKQLLLANLKELYSSFFKEHADIKIGFSKSCQLQRSGVFYWEHRVPTVYMSAHTTKI